MRITLICRYTIAAATCFSAADAQVPPTVAVQLAPLGQRVEPMATARIYAPLQPAAPAHGLEIEREVAYGQGPKQTFDLFQPTGSSQRLRPIVIFVHGGAFRFDDKSRTPDGRLSPFYDNVMLWVVSHGMVGINMNYPLAQLA